MRLMNIETIKHDGDFVEIVAEPQKFDVFSKKKIRVYGDQFICTGLISSYQVINSKGVYLFKVVKCK